MTVLFALSILAFVVLLWATLAIAGYVRRARRRQRRRNSIADTSSVGAVSGNRPEHMQYIDTQASQEQSAELWKVVAPRLETELQPRTATNPVFSSDTASLESEVQHGRQLVHAAVPVPGVMPDNTPPPLPAPPPPRLRSFPTRLGKHTPLRSTDEGTAVWNPFRKEPADLSDPAVTWRHSTSPARSKDKV